MSCAWQNGWSILLRSEARKETNSTQLAARVVAYTVNYESCTFDGQTLWHTRNDKQRHWTTIKTKLARTNRVRESDGVRSRGEKRSPKYIIQITSDKVPRESRDKRQNYAKRLLNREVAGWVQTRSGAYFKISSAGRRNMKLFALSLLISFSCIFLLFALLIRSMVIVCLFDKALLTKKITVTEIYWVSCVGWRVFAGVPRHLFVRRYYLFNWE